MRRRTLRTDIENLWRRVINYWDNRWEETFFLVTMLLLALAGILSILVVITQFIIWAVHTTH